MLASEALEDYADLLLGRELAASLSPDLTHCGFGGLLAFLAHIETVLRVRVFASRCDNERSVNYPKGEERRD